MGELAPLVPVSSRAAVRRWFARPIVEFGDAEAVFWRPEYVDGVPKLVAAARVPLNGDPAEIDAAGHAAVTAVTPPAGGTRAPKVIVALPVRQVLRKQLLLPAAVEENLVQALAYDLDRHTPFRAEQLYFDATVSERNAASKTIRVDWAAALKTVVDAARRQVEAWGAVPLAVIPGPAAMPLPRLNLIPDAERVRPALWRRWQIWAPTALVAVFALAAVLVPLAQKREYAIALNQQTESARQQALAADAIRQQLERMQEDYNFVLARKYTYPNAVQVVDDVTRVLPDDTWLTQLEVKTSTKGKDIQREMLLRGESSNAGKLISLLEDAKLVEQAALRSPTTKIQPGPGEVFDLGAQLRALQAPAPVPMASASDAAPASSAPAAGGAPATAAAPSEKPQPSAASPAGAKP